MTENQWQDCTAPNAMLEFLWASGRAGDRKLLLLACACARRVWENLVHDQSREWVEATERAADELADRGYSVTAWAGAVEIRSPTPGTYYNRERPDAAPYTTIGSYVSPETVVCLVEAMKIFHEILAECSGIIVQTPMKDRSFVEYGTVLFRVFPSVPLEVSSELEEDRLRLVRDLFGNPFRQVVLDPAWLSWRDGTVVKLAQAAYEERRYPSGALDAVRLAILADALEESGCQNADIVNHCRGPEPHVRGCWVIDALLGKEQG
jgi:biotin carboxyl carrier protein